MTRISCVDVDPDALINRDVTVSEPPGFVAGNLDVASCGERPLICVVGRAFRCTLEWSNSRRPAGSPRTMAGAGVAGESGLEHLDVEPLDSVRDGRAVAAGLEPGAAGTHLGRGVVVGVADGTGGEVGVAEGHLGVMGPSRSMKVLRRIPSLNLGGEDVVQLVGGDVADADADASRLVVEDLGDPPPGAWAIAVDEEPLGAHASQPVVGDPVVNQGRRCRWASDCSGVGSRRE